MKKIFSEIIILIIFLNIGKCSEVISLNLSYRYHNKMESPIGMYLYTNTQLGTPKMNIYSYIHSDKNQNLFSMYKVIYNLKESEEKQYYNYSISKTFKNISCFGIKYVTSKNDIHAKENFYFNIYNNKTKLYKEMEIDDLNFILGVDLFKQYGTYFLTIGFPMVNEKTLNNRFKFDLIIQLKQRKIIDEYDWFILYDSNLDQGENIIKAEEISNSKSKLIIGTPPHYYNKDKFYQSQLLKTYSDLYFWSITFKDIYVYINMSKDEKTKISTEVNTVEIYLDDIMIYGPMFYLNIMKTRYFSKYKNSCFVEKDPNFKYYCKKSEDFGINELKQFPSLYFNNVDFNYIFELTYKDLFIEINGNYYFLVTDTSDESWSIGYSLLKKYQFVFNQDSKTIGFYNPNLPIEKEEDSTDAKEKENEKEKTKEKEKEKENEKEKKKEKEKENEKDNKKEKEKEREKENKKKEKKEKENDENNVNNSGISIEIVIIIAAVCAIVFLLIGILAGKFIFKKMKDKRRANELDENYDYIAPQTNPINDN